MPTEGNLQFSKPTKPTTTKTTKNRESEREINTHNEIQMQPQMEQINGE